MTAIDLSKDAVMIDMRISIDNMDTSFLRLLSERMRVAEKIIFIKKQQNLDLNPSAARKQDMKRLIQISEQLDLSTDFFKKILELVFQGALERFKKIENQDTMALICEDLCLDDLRLNLLNLDKSVCHILTERFRTVKRIGKYKKKLQIPSLDASRWKLVLEDKKAIAQSMGINVPMIEKIFNCIHDVALSIEEIMD